MTENDLNSKCKELKYPGFITNFLLLSYGCVLPNIIFLNLSRTLLNNADYTFVAIPNLHLKVFLKCMSSIRRVEMFGCVQPDIKDINRRNCRAMEVKCKCELLYNSRELLIRNLRENSWRRQISENGNNTCMKTCWRHRTCTFACTYVSDNEYKSQDSEQTNRVDLWKSPGNRIY